MVRMPATAWPLDDHLRLWRLVTVSFEKWRVSDPLPSRSMPPSLPDGLPPWVGRAWVAILGMVAGDLCQDARAPWEAWGQAQIMARSTMITVWIAQMSSRCRNNILIAASICRCTTPCLVIKGPVICHPPVVTRMPCRSRASSHYQTQNRTTMHLYYRTASRGTACLWQAGGLRHHVSGWLSRNRPIAEAGWPRIAYLAAGVSDARIEPLALGGHPNATGRGRAGVAFRCLACIIRSSKPTGCWVTPQTLLSPPEELVAELASAIAAAERLKSTQSGHSNLIRNAPTATLAPWPWVSDDEVCGA
jgi:hypothetical protein